MTSNWIYISNEMGKNTIINVLPFLLTTCIYIYIIGFMTCIYKIQQIFANVFISFGIEFIFIHRVGGRRE